MSPAQRVGSHRSRGLAAALVGSLILLPTLTGAPTSAEPNSPSTPDATATPARTTSAVPSQSPTGTPTQTPTESTPSTAGPTSASSTPSSSAPATSAPSTSTPKTSGQTQAPKRQLRAGAVLTLAVSSVGGPQAGKFFEDIGSFGLAGRVAGDSAGQRIEVWRSGDGAKTWARIAVTAVRSDQTYATSSAVTATSKSLRFCATLGGSPAAASVVKNCPAPVTVADSTVAPASTVNTINALKDPVVTGSVSPARAGVRINLDVKRSNGKYKAATTAVTGRDGKWRASLAYGHGSLKSYRIRAAYRAANRPRWEVSSSSRVFTRVAVLDAKIAKTTGAEVAKTYRSGCPVGPSKLRTISINYYGMSDHKMHRGVIIIRSNLSDDLVRAFGAALKKRYPIAKMNNPNVYGGNDPKQMTANNTSGFNCRKVTGNPYAQSPHSYGTALDVNTVQNPYRDVHGKWWPANGKKYIDRSPLKAGMLGKNSTLTTSLRKDHFFWGGFWNPGRDYQHFQR